MGDLDKSKALSSFLANTLFPAVFAAFDQPGTKFLGNRSKGNITLHPSLRMAIGPPQPAYLLGDGFYGIYELPNTDTTAELYALQDDMAKDASFTPSGELEKLKDPEASGNIRIQVLQVWEIGEFEPL
jgi:hypothetical protein